MGQEQIRESKTFAERFEEIGQEEWGCDCVKPIHYFDCNNGREADNKRRLVIDNVVGFVDSVMQHSITTIAGKRQIKRLYDSDILKNPEIMKDIENTARPIILEELNHLSDDIKNMIIERLKIEFKNSQLTQEIISRIISVEELLPEIEVVEEKEEKSQLSDDDKKIISGVVSQIENSVSNLPDYKKEILVRKGIENIKVRFPATKENEVLFELSKAPLFAKEVFVKDDGKYKYFADQKKAKEYEMEIIDSILINSMNFRIEQDTDEIIKGRKEIVALRDVAKIREIVRKIFEETLDVKNIDLFRTVEVFKKIQARAEFPEAIKAIAKEELDKALQKEFRNRKLIGGGAF